MTPDRAASVPEMSDEAISDLWSWSATHEAEKTASTQQHAFACAIIAARDAQWIANRSPGENDQEHAAWLADKICSGNDYAKEPAQMLYRWPIARTGEVVAELMKMVDAYAFGYSYKNTPVVRRDEMLAAIKAALSHPGDAT